MSKSGKRNNKEFSLCPYNGFRLSYGTVNKEDPRVIYITGKAWAMTPQVDEPKAVVECVKKSFRNRLKCTLNKFPLLEKKFIMDFDFRPDSIVPGKRKYFSYEVLLVQRDVRPIESLVLDMQAINQELAECVSANLSSVGFEIESI